MQSDTYIHLQGSQARKNGITVAFGSDTYIHLQGSQAVYSFLEVLSTSDTYIHLQGSQAVDFMCIFLKSLIPIFTYKVLKRRIRTRRRSSV